MPAPPGANQQNISKKRKFVADGVFYAELNELLIRELGEQGYSGVEAQPYMQVAVSNSKLLWRRARWTVASSSMQ